MGVVSGIVAATEPLFAGDRLELGPETLKTPLTWTVGDWIRLRAFHVVAAID